MKKHFILAVTVILVFFLSTVYLFINVELSSIAIERQTISFISILFVLLLLRKENLKSFFIKSTVICYEVFFLLDIFYPTLKSVFYQKDLLFKNVSFLSNSEGLIMLSCGIYLIYYFVKKNNKFIKKDLNNYGVQEMNAVEMKKENGGI